MKNVIAGLLILALTAPAVFAGGQQAEDTSYDLQSMSWDEIVAQAQAEGEVSWFQWYLQPDFREFVKAFEDEYGITVTVADGSLDANKNKMFAEKDRPVGDIDVISLGGDTISTFDPAAFFYGPVTGIVPDGEKLRTKIMTGDGKNYAVAFWGNQSGLAYDPEKISESELPQNIEELGVWMDANPKALGFNTENGGSGPSFIQSVAINTAPDVDFSDGDNSPEKLAQLAPAWDWFASHEGTYVITASNADSLTRLSNGEFTIVPAWEDHLAGLQRANEVDSRVKFYIPEFGMLGGGNVVAIPSNAPRKAAAMLFLWWLTSAETQSMLNRDFGSAPQHPDASGEYALVPMSQRAFSIGDVPKPLKDDILNGFVDNVTLR